jgi:hypothetical protein
MTAWDAMMTPLTTIPDIETVLYLPDMHLSSSHTTSNMSTRKGWEQLQNSTTDIEKIPAGEPSVSQPYWVLISMKKQNKKGKNYHEKHTQELQTQVYE